MTRKECEDKLLDMAQQMYEVYKEYNPSGEMLSVTAFANGYININDAFFSDNEVVLDANDNTFKTVDAVKYSSGGRRYDTTYVKGAFA
jgi:hypothetical protein